MRLLKQGFAQLVGIDLQEADGGMADYDCLEAMFVRHLRPGVRPIDAAPDALVSPVDGTVGACGTVTAGTLLQIKGRAYSLADLLRSQTEARKFEGGTYVTLYLAPHDYHRIHAPLAGEVRQSLAVAGKLRPVFAAALRKIDSLYAHNERLITYLDTPQHGRLAVVKVGATLVGRITVHYDPSLRTNAVAAEAVQRRTYAPGIVVAKGAELGCFELGSTVVLLCGPEQVQRLTVLPGAPIKLGQCLARLHRST